ncbi:hypothetical protein LK540_11010 [Massilia sp. IC2-278]|uniref:hypothetical protein n=1 Tax=Massilia sp. IC2-278 TaxID=2887200 RepID=UPI001E4A4AAB|nr:hypothetical protein [Massilia sp. IC2-278]MCC2960952.1 hypothetical protein [Massilia sp. IC2-278]
MPKLLRYVALAIALIAALMWMRHEAKVDSCLDAGGRWDNGLGECIQPYTPGTPV